MKKSELRAIRFDSHLTLQIQELSDMLKISRSAVVRMLVTNSIKQIQDEDGNWKIPGKVHEQQEAVETCQ